MRPRRRPRSLGHTLLGAGRGDERTPGERQRHRPPYQYVWGQRPPRRLHGPCRQRRRGTAWVPLPALLWSGRRDSNPRPQPWQRGAGHSCHLPVSAYPARYQGFRLSPVEPGRTRWCPAPCTRLATGRGAEALDRTRDACATTLAWGCERSRVDTVAQRLTSHRGQGTSP